MFISVFHKKYQNQITGNLQTKAHILSQPDLKFERGSEIDRIPFSANPAVDQSFSTLPTPFILFSANMVTSHSESKDKCVKIKSCRKPGVKVVPSELCCSSHLLCPEVKGGHIDQASLAAFPAQLTLAHSALLASHTHNWLIHFQSISTSNRLPLLTFLVRVPLLVLC